MTQLMKALLYHQKMLTTQLLYFLPHTQLKYWIMIVFEIQFDGTVT